MDIQVMKFGGTSLKTHGQRMTAAKRIAAARDAGALPVAVVSAMGRMGDPYATDTLLRLLREEHQEPDPRHLDMMAACGEILSASLLAETVRSLGCQAIALNGGQAGIRTDRSYGDAQVLDVDPECIRKWLEKGYAVVVTGFQGMDPEGSPTTLGRGGSDFSAVLLAKALGVGRVHILKDVEGVLTADPKLTNKAKLIKSLSYDELYEMSRSGAKVVNFKAASFARENNIELIVQSLEGPDVGGTRIAHAFEDPDGKRKGSLLTAIVSKDGIAQYLLGESDQSRISKMLDVLSEKGVSLDMISLADHSQMFTVDEGNCPKVGTILEHEGLDHSVRKGCSKLTIVGQAIHGMPGVMARLMSALNHSGIKVLQTADSHTTISCLMDTGSIKRATHEIHDVFNL